MDTIIITEELTLAQNTTPQDGLAKASIAFNKIEQKNSVIPEAKHQFSSIGM
jgi:hypothetical protein